MRIILIFIILTFFASGSFSDEHFKDSTSIIHDAPLIEENQFVDICSKSLKSYQDFTKINRKIYLENFGEFSTKYLNSLKACPSNNEYRYGVREIIFDKRSDEEIHLNVVEYFDITYSDLTKKSRNTWSAEIHRMARHKELSNKTKLKLYDMAESHGDSIVAFVFTQKAREDIPEAIYKQVVEDYLFRKELSKRFNVIYKNLILNSTNKPLSKEGYYVLTSSSDTYVRDRAKLRLESSSENEYQAKLLSYTKERTKRYLTLEKIKRIVFFLPFVLLFTMSGLLAYRRQESKRSVKCKFLIWLPQLVFTVFLLLSGILYPPFSFWLLLPVLYYLIYKTSTNMILQTCLSLLIILILGVVLYGAAIAIGSLV